MKQLDVSKTDKRQQRTKFKLYLLALYYKQPVAKTHFFLFLQLKP